MKNKSILTLSLIIMGLGGIAGQVLLLREILISFLGNELTLGIILANWLILEGIGSFVIGQSVEKVKNKLEIFVLLQLVFSIALPFAVYLSRIFKNVLLVTPGEALGFAPIFYSSLVILLPVAVPHGALFTYGCKIYSQTVREDASTIGKVYLLETLGSIFGGLCMTFFLIQYLNSFEIAFINSLMNSLISIPLLRPFPGSPNHPIKTLLCASSVFLSLFFAFCLFPQASNMIQDSSIRSQWKGFHVIHNENSIYGNIAVTKRGEQFTFFTNGIPSITTPVPDIAAAEDFVHFPMLFHPHPETILVLGNGVGGTLHEILKYPVKCVDYVEIDPLLLRLVQKYATPLTRSELSDPRVKVHYADGRFFVNQTGNRYDVIFIGLPAPQELQTNRLFSSEFFMTAREKMTPEGIFVLTLPGSLTYISPELRGLNDCIFATLKTAFRSVRIIPGDVNLYLASNSSRLESVSTKDLIKKFEADRIKTNLVTRSYIEFRLQERWVNWLMQSLKGEKFRVNSDFRPVGVFLSLSYWNALFSPYLREIFDWFEGFSLRWFIAGIALFTVLMAIIFTTKSNISRQTIVYAVFTTGLAGMIFNLAVIFTFQSLYGYLYQHIGLLIAIFMSGVAWSSFTMTRRLDRIERDIFYFVKIEIAIILFSFLFPFVFTLPFRYLGKTALNLLTYPLFLIMSFLSGTWIGLQFPLSGKIYLAASSKKGTLGYTAGLLYGADLLGGFWGGLLGGILLLPILGLKASCLLIGILKISSGLLLILFIKLKK